jgi:hypothetical protein
MLRSCRIHAVVVLLLATLAGAGGCCSGLERFRSSSCLEGSWELVSANYTLEDGRTVGPEPGLRSLKILSGGHFTYITVAKNGAFIRSSGGEYEVCGSRYVEHVLYASLPALRGRDFAFTWERHRDLWFHKGSVGTLRVDEVWRRTGRTPHADYD